MYESVQSELIMRAQLMPNFSFSKTPERAPEWSDKAKSITHLDDSTFNQWLGSGKEHAIVMFHVPWCGYCKKARPEYAAAADKLVGHKSLHIAAVDCTTAKGKHQTCHIFGMAIRIFDLKFCKNPYQSVSLIKSSS